MAEVVDLTDSDSASRDIRNRWTIKERVKNCAVKVDPLLAFKPFKIVHKDNFTITRPRDLKRIPPQNTVTSLRPKLLQSPQSVVIWDGYGIFDWRALNTLSEIHEERRTANRVQEEFKWLQQFSDKETKRIEKFVYSLWYGSRRNQGRESLLCDRLISDEVIEEILKICNNRSEMLNIGEMFILLNTSQRVHIPKEVKKVHFVINVTKKNGDVYITPPNECGTHWSYLCLDIDEQHATYIDSLGWNVPSNLTAELVRLVHTDSCTTFNKNFSYTTLHESQAKPNNRSHVCSDSCGAFAPLQTCGSICGVSVLSICLLRFNKQLWEQLQLKNFNYHSPILQAIKAPTKHSRQLRLLLMSCIEKNDIDLSIFEETCQVRESVMENNKDCKSYSLHPRKEVKVNFNDIFLTALNQAKQDKKRKTNGPVMSASKKLCSENILISKEKVSSAKKKPENDISEEVYHKLKNLKTVSDKTQKELRELSKFEKQMLEKEIEMRKNKKRSNAAKKIQKVQPNIKTVFQNMKENIPVNGFRAKKDVKLDKQNFVYTEGVTFKGLSRKFFMKIGTKANKNIIRDKMRADKPLIEGNGKKIGLERNNDKNRNASNPDNPEMDKSNINTYILQTIEYMKKNGPIVKTQKICDFYQSLKQKSKRVISSEFVEKLGRHTEIKQVYINGTGYLINGEYKELIPVLDELEEMCQSQEQQSYNKKIKDRIENHYAILLKSLKDPYDRQLIKGFMASITTADLMTQIEGKKNKRSHTQSRNSLKFNLNEYKSMEQQTLTVRNDMTNLQQRLFSKRLLEKRKKQELKCVFKGRGRLHKSEQFPELASVLEMCFGELSVLVGGSGLESHPRLSNGVLYRACDNNMLMKRARDIILQLAPENFQISLSSCYNYTENYRAGSHQAKQHHAGSGINANISLNAPPRTGVENFVINLHWTTSNVNLLVDQGEVDKENTFIDSKDAKSVVCANVAPVQKIGKSWSKRENLDHDWNQSRTFAVTPMTHLIMNSEQTLEVTGHSSILKVKRTGQAITLVNISHFEPETAFRTLNDILLLMHNQETSEFFRNTVTGDLKKNFIFVVDNGPSTCPNNIIVQMCLVRLLKFLDLDSICQVSYAEYHSKRNPVERVHAEENRALSRHGPFKVDTKLIKVGSKEHRTEMEVMLQDVAQCLRTGQFNKNHLIAIRGITAETSVFKDEERLKNFVTMTEDQKDLCEETYTISDCKISEELSIVWKINTDYTGSYINDYMEIQSKSLKNKYTFKLLKEPSSAVKVQPIPDYMKYMKTEELHYLNYSSSQIFLELFETETHTNDTALFLPSRILDICWTLDPDPPQYIITLISILSWVPCDQVCQYYEIKNAEQKAIIERDKDIISWRQHELYRKTKLELQNQCKLMSLNCTGTKIELIKRLAGNDKGNSIYIAISDIPNSLSGIASMHVAAIRTVLGTLGLSIFGSKEELVLRLFMHKHQPDVVFKSERDALLDVIQIAKQIIKTQSQLDLVSLNSERMFSSNKNTTTRKKTLNTERIAPKVGHPPHLTFDTIPHLYDPLKDFINKEAKTELQKTKSFTSMTTVGSTLKIKWQKDELSGTGWAPGWYSAVVTNYDRASDELEVEYLLERGYKYSMNYTEMLTKGLIEPTKLILAKLETYEKVTTIGQEVQIRVDSDWQDAQVVQAEEEEDIIHVKLMDSPNTLHTVEVSPAVGKSLRLKKRVPDNTM